MIQRLKSYKFIYTIEWLVGFNGDIVFISLSNVGKKFSRVLFLTLARLFLLLLCLILDIACVCVCVCYTVCLRLMPFFTVWMPMCMWLMAILFHLLKCIRLQIYAPEGTVLKFLTVDTLIHVLKKKNFYFILLCVCVCVFLSPFLFRLFAVKTTQSDSLEHRAHSTSFETCQWMSFAIINISSRTFGHTDTRSDRTPEHSWKSGSNMNFETKIKCTASINTWTIKSLRWCVYLHGQCTSPRYQWRQPRTCRVEESIQSSSKWANHKNLAPCEHI